MIKVTSSQKNGFTIIELMIATTIFSLVLMICLSGIMQITKMYYRGVTQTRTRETARTIVDEIAESLRFSNQSIQIGAQITGPQINNLSDPDTSYFCIGQKRYTYAIDRQVKSNPKVNSKQRRHALWLDSPVSCNQPVQDFFSKQTPSAGGKDLLPENMRLYDLTITLRDADKKVYDISVGVAYGDDDLLRIKQENTSQLTCEGASIGAEFCATTNFLVTVEKRL